VLCLDAPPASNIPKTWRLTSDAPGGTMRRTKQFSEETSTREARRKGWSFPFRIDEYVWEC
jgi:hypothetical protein